MTGDKPLTCATKLILAAESHRSALKQMSLQEISDLCTTKGQHCTEIERINTMQYTAGRSTETL